MYYFHLMKVTTGLAQLIIQWVWQNPAHDGHSGCMASRCLMARHSISIRAQSMLLSDLRWSVTDCIVLLQNPTSLHCDSSIGACYKFYKMFFPVTNISKTIQKTKSYGPWGTVPCIIVWTCFRGLFTLKPGNHSYHSVNGFGQDSKG